MKLKKGSTVLIPWSGGLDSTYLVYHALKCGCNVTTVYYTIENNRVKVDVELIAREAMMPFLRRTAHEHNVHFHDMGEVFKFDVLGSGNNTGERRTGRFTQMPLWITASAFNAGRHDYVAFGIVRNDDTVSWMKEYTRIFNMYKHVKEDIEPVCNTKLIFPLSKTGKDRLLAELPYELKDHLWVCEMPRVIGGVSYACENCKPCHTHPGKLKTYNPSDLELRDQVEQVYPKCEDEVDEIDASDTTNITRKTVRRIRNKAVRSIKLKTEVAR